MVEVSVFFCITMWLPRCLTSANQCSSRIAQISRPERILILPNSNLKAGDEHFAVHSVSNFLGRGRFEEKFEGLLQV